MASNITFPGDINEGSRATPGLWNRISQGHWDNYSLINNDASASSDRLAGWNKGSVSTVIQSSSTIQGPIVDAGGQFHNVKAYGATGDGSTNDTPAIQAAISAASSAGGGIVFFPEGTYSVNVTLDCKGDNIALQGLGQRIDTDTAGSVIKKSFNGTLIDATGNPGGDHIDGFQMQSLTVDGQSHAGGFTGTALDLTATSGPYVRNVEFVGVIGSAMKLAETWDFTGDNIWIRSSGNSTAEAALDITDTASGVVARADFYSLHMESNFTTHLYMHTDNLSTRSAQQVRFFGCKFHDSQTLASQIQTPLVKCDSAMHPVFMGTQFSISSNVEQLRYGGQFGLLDILMNDATGDYALNITGGARSDIRAIVTASSLNTACYVAGGNHRIRLITNGIASAATVIGTAMVTEERDNVFRLWSGQFDFREPGADSAKDPTTDAPADWVEVQVEGVTRYIPVYAAS